MKTYNATQHEVKAALAGELGAILVPMKDQPFMNKLGHWEWRNSTARKRGIQFIARYSRDEMQPQDFQVYAKTLCPYKPGQLAAVRESVEEDHDSSDKVVLARYCADKAHVYYPSDTPPCTPKAWPGAVMHWSEWSEKQNKLSSARMRIKHSRMTFRFGERKLLRANDIGRRRAKSLGFLPGLNGLEKYDGKSYGSAEHAYEAMWIDRYGKKYPWETNPYCWYMPVDVIHKNISEVNHE